MDRRKFLGGAAAIAAVGCVASKPINHGGRYVGGLSAGPLKSVRFGIIGVGRRGGETLLRLMLEIDGVEIRALCDTVDEALAKNAARVVEATGSVPATYGGDESAYLRLLDRQDIDAVIIATPWKYHTPMAVAAMNAGKHAFVEVPAALTVEECWELVETAERTQLHCMMLENVCYGREEMMVMNMVRDGLFGELLHGEAAYIHELRWQMHDLENGTGSWRTDWHAKRDANLYPTHGLGPIAQFMNINRGDKFDYMVSMSSAAVGRQAYAKQQFPPDHKRNTTQYIAGDMNTSLIQTAQGRSILLQHDTTTPRPYTRLNLIQGTNGSFASYPNRIALENNPFTPDVTNGFHHWDVDMSKWYDKYEHNLWKKLMSEATTSGGHGGMDFVMLWRLVYCLQNGLAMDQSVYDAASWSVVVDLSERSVESRSSSIDFPDFTNGKWKTEAPLVIEQNASGPASIA